MHEGIVGAYEGANDVPRHRYNDREMEEMSEAQSHAKISNNPHDKHNKPMTFRSMRYTQCRTFL